MASRLAIPANSAVGGGDAAAGPELSSPSQFPLNTVGENTSVPDAARLRLEAFRDMSVIFLAMIGALITSINSAKSNAPAKDSALLLAFVSFLSHMFAAIHSTRVLASPAAESSNNQYDYALATSRLWRFGGNLTFSTSLGLSGFVMFDHSIYIVLCLTVSFLSLLVFTYEQLKASNMLEQWVCRRRSASSISSVASGHSV